MWISGDNLGIKTDLYSLIKSEIQISTNYGDNHRIIHTCQHLRQHKVLNFL
ncbi:hypothetical protein CLW00_102276 [Mongoliibacter ruber]|uniref:Uncharacterized protein n=1 Tax=Mongoliibacter ruber TaxID=1750599 RepID=A0A2T0WSZ5_9BACT|nr:hypothetical protein CLW00_102276 [Mongoliibacter ruber]